MEAPRKLRSFGLQDGCPLRWQLEFECRDSQSWSSKSTEQTYHLELRIIFQVASGLDLVIYPSGLIIIFVDYFACPWLIRLDLLVLLFSSSSQGGPDLQW